MKNIAAPPRREGMSQEPLGSHRERLRARIDELEKHIEELKVRARQAESEVRSKLHREGGPRELIEETLARLKEVREASDAGWEEMKAGAEKLWMDARAAWDRGGEKAADEPPKEAGSPPSETP
jgi:chromosome segregation ATPase